MSLLDDVSIVVTPNGYKAGELYAVIPVPTEGAEEVVDSSFANDLDDWSKYGVTSATGGIATIGASANSGIYQGVLTQGVRYTVTVNVTSYDGVGTAQFTNNNGNNLYTITETGIQTFTFISTIASSNLIIRGMSNALFSLSSVSVKEYTSADMDVTRATDATRVNESGLIEDVLANVPRIDYTGGGCPHILAEPQRTNLVTYSEDFSDSSWTKSGVTLTAGQISPSGDTSAYKLAFSANNDYVQAAISGLDISKEYTLSFYAKVDSGTTTIESGNVNGGAYETLTITDEWKRFEVTQTPSGTTRYPRPIRSNGSDEIYLWGAQLEEGSYATSYIPTSGGTVTRNQDIFTRDGIGSLINSTEGVLFVEVAALSDDSDNYISITDGSTVNLIAINLNSSGFVTARYTIAGVTKTFTSTVISTNNNKVAIKWKVNDFALWVNGIEIDTDLTLSVLSANTLNTLDFTRSAGQEFYGKVKQLQVYDTALTDVQLAALTS